MFGIHPILSPVGLSDTQVNVFFPHTQSVLEVEASQRERAGGWKKQFWDSSFGLDNPQDEGQYLLDSPSA